MAQSTPRRRESTSLGQHMEHACLIVLSEASAMQHPFFQYMPTIEKFHVTAADVCANLSTLSSGRLGIRSSELTAETRRIVRICQAIRPVFTACEFSLCMYVELMMGVDAHVEGIFRRSGNGQRVEMLLKMTMDQLESVCGDFPASELYTVNVSFSLWLMVSATFTIWRRFSSAGCAPCPRRASVPSWWSCCQA